MLWTQEVGGYECEVISAAHNRHQTYENSNAMSLTTAPSFPPGLTMKGFGCSTPNFSSMTSIGTLEND
jgi:hypothetical protein